MKQQTGLTACASVVALAALTLCSSLPARAGTVGVIVARYAHVRSGPSKHAALVATVYRGKRLNVDGEQNGWDHFTNPDIKGWVLAIRLSFNTAATSAPPGTPALTVVH